MEATNSSRAPKKSATRGSGLFLLLTASLFLLTLFGLLSCLSVGGSLESAVEKTKTRLEKQERDLLFLFDCLEDGGLSLEGEGIHASWNADLPERGSLVLTENKDTFGYYLTGDTVTVNIPFLFEHAKSGARRGSAVLEKSVFSTEGLRREHRALALTLSALSDPSLWENEPLFDGLETVFQKARPAPEKEKGFDWEEHDLTCTKITYSFDSEALVRSINALAKEGKNEAFRESFLAFAGLARALCDHPLSEKDAAKIDGFLTGQSEDFNTLSAQMGKSDSFATLSFFEKGGYLAGASGTWRIGTQGGSFSLYLGSGAKREDRTFSLSCLKDDKEMLSLTLSDRITDDSEQAFIREFDFSLSDQSGFWRDTEKPEQTVLFRYSWGREKGDLGLKILLPEEEINFRASLESYNRGSGAVLLLKRIEENRKNLLAGKEVRITLSDRDKVAAPPSAKEPLFPKPEERESLQSLFSQNYQARFGEAS